MQKIREDIFGQHLSLRQTYAYMQSQAGIIKDFYGISGFYSITLTGCGPIFPLCSSAELSLRMRGGMTALSMPAGDLSLNGSRYLDMLNGTMLLASSSTGGEEDLIAAVNRARAEAGATVIGCSTAERAALSDMSDIQLELPWAADSGDVATRSISNIHLVNLFNIGLLTSGSKLIDELKDVTDDMERFIECYTEPLTALAGDGDQIVILADGELSGLARAGTTVFRALSPRTPVWHSTLLDSRHCFPPGFIGERTLVLAAQTPDGDESESRLLRDISATGATLVTLAPPGKGLGVMNLDMPPVSNHAAWGFGFLFVLQALAQLRGGQ